MFVTAMPTTFDHVMTTEFVESRGVPRRPPIYAVWKGECPPCGDVFFSSLLPYGMEDQSLTQVLAKALDSLIGRDRGKPVKSPSGATAADAPFGRDHQDNDVRNATRSAADDPSGWESQAESKAVSQN